MPLTLKNFIKIGMRNPYFVDVKNLQGEGQIFIQSSSATDLQDSVKLTKFEDKANGLDEQVNQITELPSNLLNFYHIVEHQASKLSYFVNFV